MTRRSASTSPTGWPTATSGRTPDPEEFEIAFTAIPHAPGGDGDDEPIPVCRQCGGLAAIFPDRGLHWQHFRSYSTTSAARQTYDPGHTPEATWILPNEDGLAR
jgi:hypothetical protein